MGKKAERSNHIDGGQRQKQPDKSEYVFQSAQEKSQIGDNGKHQSDDLVFGQCRHGLRNGEHAAGEDKTACVTQGNDAVVGRAENIDGNPERKGQKQRQSAEYPGGKKLSPDESRHRNRHGHNLDDGFGTKLLAPQPHGNAGNKQKVKPGLKGKHR